MSAVQLSLITEPAARRTDPPSSVAAAQIAARNETPREALIKECFRLWGPMNADLLCQRLGEPARRWNTVRSHLSRLQHKGLVSPTGDYAPSVCGVDQQVWKWNR